MNLGDLIHDRYRLERPLGKGGMAEVWCATDERLARPVAIKFLAPQFHDDPEFLVRFFSEAQSVAGISHPNVVQVLDFGEHKDRPYLVMEYVGGGSVADLTGTPLLPDRSAEIQPFGQQLRRRRASRAGRDRDRSAADPRARTELRTRTHTRVHARTDAVGPRERR